MVFGDEGWANAYLGVELELNHLTWHCVNGVGKVLERAIVVTDRNQVNGQLLVLSALDIVRRRLGRDGSLLPYRLLLLVDVGDGRSNVSSWRGSMHCWSGHMDGRGCCCHYLVLSSCDAGGQQS